MSRNFPRGVAIAGIGDVDYGTLYRQRELAGPRDPYAMAAEAFRNALDDSGLTKDDIDGVLCVRDLSRYEYFCYRVGIDKPRLVNGLERSGRASGVTIQYAAMAIASGMVDTVLVIYANNGRSSRSNYGSDGVGGDPYGFVHGMTSPGAQVAAMFNRYRHEFGVTEEALGAVALNHRFHAGMNERSVFKTPLTMEEYKTARYITEPFRLFDYCMINDGAVAVILTTVERARDLKKPVVEIIGASACGDMASSFVKRDFFYQSTHSVAEDLYAQAGVKPSDLHTVGIYDNFTATVLFSMEGIGLCERGGAGEYIAREGLSVGKAKIPINTSGGHTSEAYMQGFNHQVECVRQLRGECGARQVPDCSLAMYVCTSPIVTGHILARR